MLVAAQKNKLTRSRADSFREDEVTSCIFESLESLPIKEIQSVFEKLASDAKLISGEEKLFERNPDEAIFNFWPTWRSEEQKKVEPDLVLEFKENGKIVLRIIMEIKWNSNIFPPCQLVWQWINRNQNDTDVDCVHLYLVKDKALGDEAIKKSKKIIEKPKPCQYENSCGRSVNCKKPDRILRQRKREENWRVGCIAWRNFASVAGEIRNQKWSERVRSFLRRLGISDFSGFSWLEEEEYIELLNGDVLLPFFKKEPWFIFLCKSLLQHKHDEFVFWQPRKKT